MGRSEIPSGNISARSSSPTAGHAGVDQRLEVGVVEVVVPGERDITRVVANRDVGDARLIREPVERGVGLDEAPMRLRVEVGHHVVTVAVSMSSHGETRSSDVCKRGVWNTSNAEIICIHVVPHFAGVLMMMSSGRSSKPSQRALSEISDR